MITIGIDTLFEDPIKGSSALNYLYEMVRGLCSAPGDHRVVVLVSHSNKHLFEPLLGQRGSLAIAGVSNERRLLRILTQQILEPIVAAWHGVDVLFAPGNVFPLLWRRPVVLKISTLHHIHTPERIGWLRSRYRRLMFHLSARRATAVLANTQQTRMEMIHHMGVQPSQVRLIYEAVGAEFVPDQSDGEAAELNRTYRLQPGYVLFVSALYGYKNASLALEAFIQASRDLPAHVDFVVVGQNEGDAAERLQLRASKVGLEHRFRYLGSIPNPVMPALFRQAGVFVYPSSSETFGKPVLEAYRSRTPVLAADIPTLREVGGDAAIFLPLAADLWSEALIRLYRDNELRDRLVEMGERRGVAFSFRTTVAETLQLLHEAAACR